MEFSIVKLTITLNNKALSKLLLPGHHTPLDKVFYDCRNTYSIKMKHWPN